MKQSIRCRLGRHKWDKTMHVEPVGNMGVVAVLEATCQRCKHHTVEYIKVDTRG